MGLLLDTLRHVDFLQGAHEEAVLRFMVLGRCVYQKKGHCFWRAGYGPQGVVIPVSGSLKSVTRNHEGREFIERFVGPGEYAGLADSIAGLPHATNGEVLRAGEFFTILPAALERFFREYPVVHAASVRAVGHLVRDHLREREDMALRPVPERLARLLLDRACVRSTAGAKVLLEATQAELAARLGTVREVVARQLARFSERGLLERNRDGIFIVDWEGLRAEAGMDSSDDRAASFEGRDAEEATARFFLPLGERRGRRWEPDPSGCRAHLGDLSLCRSLGCPAADEPPTEAGKRRS